MCVVGAILLVLACGWAEIILLGLGAESYLDGNGNVMAMVLSLSLALAGFPLCVIATLTMLIQEEARRTLPVVPRSWQRLLRIGVVGVFIAVGVFLLVRMPRCMRQEKLISAVRAGDIAQAREILQRPVELNAQGVDGLTALHYAVLEGRRDLAAMLLQKGANVNIKETDSRLTPLHMAAREGKSGIVEFLVQNGANMEARAFGCGGCDSRTPLISAVRGGHPEMVAVLVRLGTDVDTRDHYGNTLLHQLSGPWIGPRAMEMRAEIAEALIQAGADIDARNDWDDTPLDVAKEMEAGDIVRVLEKYQD